jgi:trimeric autotransporter adhesin
VDLTMQASWSSSDITIAQVSNAPRTNGLVTGLGVGSASITATSDGVQGSTTITVSPAVLTSISVMPPDPSIAKGITVQLTATGVLSDATTVDLTSQASWTSGDNTIAQASNAAGTKWVDHGLGRGKYKRNCHP